MNSKERTPVNTTLNTYLNNKLDHLVEERNIPIENLMDKAVDLLLDYMKTHETVTEYVKAVNKDVINRNNEILNQCRELINKRNNS